MSEQTQEQSFPLFRLSAAWRRGKPLTQAQRSSPHFDPEPRIGNYRFHPGLPPQLLSEAEFRKHAIRIFQLMRSESVVVEAKRDERDDWDRLNMPTLEQFHRARARVEELDAVEAELIEASEENGAAAPSPVIIPEAPPASSPEKTEVEEQNGSVHELTEEELEAATAPEPPEVAAKSKATSGGKNSKKKEK